MKPVERLAIDNIVNLALTEDLGGGDATTDALIPAEWRGKGIFLAKAEGIVAGMGIAIRVFETVDPRISVSARKADGRRVKPGDIIATVTGSYASITKAERVALNFLQRLSGIATETSRFVVAVKGLPVKIVDTRKTTPGMRQLEKYAVRMGGGYNHRQSLSDGILIKDNHIAALRAKGLSIKQIIEQARHNGHALLKIEVEVSTVADAVAAARAGADIIMLDNMSLLDMQRAVKAVRRLSLTEASGRVTLDQVRAVAETGVDLISIGALTHSTKSLDISLEMELIR